MTAKKHPRTHYGNKSFAAWPDRLYVVDQDSKLAVLGQQGPAGFAPAVREAQQWLEKHFLAKPDTVPAR